MSTSFLDAKSAFIMNAGDPMAIIRPSGNIPTYAKEVKGRQLLSPFEINFVRFMLFLPDSGLIRGDLVLNQTTNEQSFVAAIQPHTLQGAVSGLSTELYVTNYPAVPISRIQQNYDNSGNLIGPSAWNSVATVPMSVEHVVGGTPYKDGLLLANTVFRCILQTSVALQLNDRLTIDSKPYRVDDINISIAPGLQVVQVSADMR